MVQGLGGSDTFQGFVTGPDGSVYQNTLHTLTVYGGTVETWSTLTQISGPVASGSSSGTSASTGVNPVETSYSLFGHTIPLSCFGVGRIGGDIIAGPWVSNGLASFCISLGVPADPSGARDIREIAFDSEIVWTTNGASGVTTSAGGTFNTEAFTFRFYQGTLSQSADALETSHFGADAVAYRPQILLWFENLPLSNTKFGKIPYVAAVIGDSSGDDVNLGEAFERLAASPWVEFSGFETSGVTDGLVGGGLIFAEQAEFLATIQQFGRFYTTWDILQTDKLRIVDRGQTVSADITLDKSSLMGDISVIRQGQDTIKKDLELSTIDPDADYTIVPSVAQIPNDPVTVTASVGKETAYLPVIMDSSTRTSIVTLARYHGEVTRKTISGTAMAYGLEIEPGALIRINDLGDDFNNETFKVVETLHGVNNTVEFTAVSIMSCSTGEDVSVEVVDASTTAYDTNTIIDQTIPADTDVGDLLIAVVMHRDTLTPPSGWTLVNSTSCIGSGVTQYTSVYSRIALLGDAGSTTAWSQASSVRIGVHIITVRSGGGCSVLTSATASQSNVSNSVVMATVTATAGGQMGLAFASSVVANAGVGVLNYTILEASAGWTQTTQTLAELNRLGAAYRVLNSGDVTTGTYTNDISGSGNNGWACVSILVG